MRGYSKLKGHFISFISECDDSNAKYSNYAPSCEPTCETIGSSCTSPTILKPGCYCKEGFVKNCQGFCVASALYCKTCLPNEYHTDCGPNPESSCQNPDMATNSKSTKPGCVCRTGYLRSYNNTCIKPNDCPC